MRYLSLILLLSFLISCTETEKKASDEPNQEQALEQKIAQLLMVGFRGTSLEAGNHIIKDVQERNLGGVVFFDYDVESKGKRNIVSPEQVKKLAAELQNLSKTKLLIAIDQEGGKVNRLKTKYGFADFHASAQHLGEIDQLDSTRYWADLTAKTLQDLGINLNFAPVVDVNVNPLSPAIGNKERSFSADPATVSKHAQAAIEAHKAHGVATCLKHFPGHGNASADSHAGFTDITETWSEKELIPYENLIASQSAQMIMTAHIFNSNLDDKVPATLSKPIITGVLREKLGWKGVVISDDMHMGAITENYGLEDAIEKCLGAGVDILVFANNNGRFYNANAVPEAISIIKKLVQEKKISMDRIDESLARIKALKATL